MRGKREHLKTNRYNIRNAEKNYIFIWVSYCQNMKNCEAFRKAITSSINLIYLEESTYMYQDTLSNIKSLISDILVVDIPIIVSIYTKLIVSTTNIIFEDLEVVVVVYLENEQRH